MKLKDILALALLAIVLLVVGSLLINRFSGGNKERRAEVEVVKPIEPNFDSQAREILLGHNQEVPIENFSLPIDFQQGLGNTSPFRAE